MSSCPQMFNFIDLSTFRANTLFIILYARVVQLNTIIPTNWIAMNIIDFQKEKDKHRGCFNT